MSGINKMKLYVLSTTSESGDHYTYLIKHPQRPTRAELKAFLIKYSTDKDDNILYESIRGFMEFDGKAGGALIPKMSKEDLDKWETL